MTEASERNLIEATEEIIERLKNLRPEFEMSDVDFVLACRLALRRISMEGLEGNK